MLNKYAMYANEMLISCVLHLCDESFDTDRCEGIAVWQVIGSGLSSDGGWSGFAGLGSMLLKCSVFNPR